MRPSPTRDRVCFAMLGVIVVGLLATPLLPFVNRPVLWLGLPSMLVWMVGLIVLITPVLAVLEAGRVPERDGEDQA